MRFDAVVFPYGVIRKSSAEVCIKKASQGVKATRATVALVWWRGSELMGGGDRLPRSAQATVALVWWRGIELTWSWLGKVEGETSTLAEHFRRENLRSTPPVYQLVGEKEGAGRTFPKGETQDLRHQGISW